jgi:hypothetical protein
MILNKSLILEAPQKGNDILELSAPQEGGVDPVTGENITAKVLHPSLSLPAGYTCPFATECRSRTVPSGKTKTNVNRSTGETTTFNIGKVVDGPLCKFRCFAASNEGIYADAREMRNRNMEKLTGIHPDKTFGDITDNDNPLNINNAEMDEFDKELRGDESAFGDLVSDIATTIHDEKSIMDVIVKTLAANEKYITKTGIKTPAGKGVLRVHVSGDFFSQAYFNAWMGAAKLFPDITFYAYTKSIPYWVKAKTDGIIPKNFKLNGSYGGSKDDLIRKNEFKFARVCFTKEEAENYPYVDADKTELIIDSDGKEAQQYWIDENGIRTEIVGLYVCEEDDIPAFRDNEPPFALLLHGTQPKGSEAQSAIAAIKSEGKDEAYTNRVNFIQKKFPSLTELDAQIVLIIYLMYYKVIEKGTDARQKKLAAVNDIARMLVKEDGVAKSESIGVASSKFVKLDKDCDIESWAAKQFLINKTTKSNIKKGIR